MSRSWKGVNPWQVGTEEWKKWEKRQIREVYLREVYAGRVWTAGQATDWQKCCRKCGRWKSIGEFRWADRKANRLRGQCKECERRLRRERRKRKVRLPKCPPTPEGEE